MYRDGILATYTRWNLFNAEFGPASLLSSMQGSYIPLPRTRVDRERSKDPRTSIEERYESRERYLALVTEAARELVHGQYLIEADVASVVKRAGEHWDVLAGSR